MKSFPSHIFAFSESVHGIRLCGAPPTKRTKVAELRIASKMCICVPDEKHLGFKYSPSNTSKSLAFQSSLYAMKNYFDNSRF